MQKKQLTFIIFTIKRMPNVAHRFCKYILYNNKRMCISTLPAYEAHMFIVV